MFRRFFQIVVLALFLMNSSVSRAQGLVDVHAHIIPKEYMDFLSAHDALLDEDFPIPAWDVESHLEFMDNAGIQTSVLTMPAPQPYFGDASESAKIIRKVNEITARTRDAYSGRFMFCASLPLPDVDAAIEEAIYSLDVLKADGVRIASNSRGLYLGDPALEPLMKVLNDRKAVIIVHPHKPTYVNPELTANVPLASFEYLAETTRAILNMVAADVLVRYPDLKVVVPHCGSFMPLAVPRIQSLLPVMVQRGFMKPTDIQGNLSRLYYDLAGAPTPDTAKELLTITTPSHILYGSDYPYVATPVLEAGVIKLRETLSGIVPESVEDILYRNALELFKR